MSKYILFTKFWNEEDKLEPFISHISKQSKKPVVWMFADDGSVDNSQSVIEEVCPEYDLEYLIGGRPTPKPVPNYETIGYTYRAVFDEYIDKLDSRKAGYFCMLDVDTRLPEDYYSTGMKIMEKHPEIGVVAGQIRQDPPRSWPQGSGSIHRWKVINQINRIWRMDPDSLFNIKAIMQGYHTVVVTDWLIDSEPSKDFRDRDFRYRYGRRNWYTGYSPLIVLYKSIVSSFQKKGRVDKQRLQGFVHEAMSGNRQFDDDDVRQFRSAKRYISRKLGLIPEASHRLKLEKLL